MRKLICLFLIVTMLCSASLTAFAASDDNIDLDSLANLTIEKSVMNSEIVYKNIDEFVEKAYSLYADITDFELAEFIMNYTGQNPNNLEKEDVLECLEFSEIVVNDDYVKVGEDGEVAHLSKENLYIQMLKEKLAVSKLESWTSPNGYMKLTTTCSLNKTSGNKRYYVVSCTAIWLKMPTCFFEDVLTIGHTGKYDNSYTGTAYFKQTSSCCAHSFSYSDTATSKVNGENVHFEYPDTTLAAIRFGLINPKVYQCNTNSFVTHARSATAISAYIKYRIIENTGETLNVQGAYCHKQVSIGSISITLSKKGTPSFSLSGSRKDYMAEPLTIYT